MNKTLQVFLYLLILTLGVTAMQKLIKVSLTIWNVPDSAKAVFG